MSEVASYPDACCYGCFKIAPKSELPNWLCAECVAKRAAAKEAKKESDDDQGN